MLRKKIFKILSVLVAVIIAFSCFLVPCSATTVTGVTKFGDINVNSYYAIGKFTSQKGGIYVNSRGDFADEYYTQINNVDGDVKIYNEVNRLLLTTTGRSDVDITFGKIKEGKIFQHK